MSTSLPNKIINANLLNGKEWCWLYNFIIT